MLRTGRSLLHHAPYYLEGISKVRLSHVRTTTRSELEVSECNRQKTKPFPGNNNHSHREMILQAFLEMYCYCKIWLKVMWMEIKQSKGVLS
jgi:hypothetical protein